MVERELHVDNIKTNECRIRPPACGVNSPHANLHDSFRWTLWKYVSTTHPTTEVQHALGRVVGCDHHRRPAVEKVSPQVVIRGVTAREGVTLCIRGDENDLEPTRQECHGHRKLDTAPFLVDSCGVCDHACL
jgi:hypothetical protein